MNDDGPRFSVEDPRIMQQASAGRAPAGDDLLPPVEPPSAGFIVQLFVIPALIVLLIVAVWLGFNWLVRAASQPQDVIQGLESGPSVARWQRASELADMLRNKRYADFKRDGKSAANLARILEREMANASMDENAIEFRKYLALALGEFHVQEGIDTLLKAAETNRNPAEQPVRRSAVEAIAVRAFNLPKLSPPQTLAHPDLEPALIQLSTDEDPLLRRRVAFALGQIGTPTAIEHLELTLDDPDSHTRYNAAVALAHRGDARAIDTLAEMLDLEEHAAMRGEEDEATLAQERAVILHTAIEASLSLARENPDVDLSPVLEMLGRIVDASDADLAKAHLPPVARSDARRALNNLQKNTAAPKST